MLGEGEDRVREKMKRGIIRAKDIALPGRRPRYVTTWEWLSEYQAETMAPAPPPTAPRPHPTPAAGVADSWSYRKARTQRPVRRAS
jgi:hypothetical protein